MKITIDDVIVNDQYRNRVPTDSRNKAAQILLSLSGNLENSAHRLIESVSVRFPKATQIGFCMEFFISVILPRQKKTRIKFVATWEVDLRDNISFNKKILLRAEENPDLSNPFGALGEISRLSNLGPYVSVKEENPPPYRCGKSISFCN